MIFRLIPDIWSLSIGPSELLSFYWQNHRSLPPLPAIVDNPVSVLSQILACSAISITKLYRLWIAYPNFVPNLLTVRLLNQKTVLSVELRGVTRRTVLWVSVLDLCVCVLVVNFGVILLDSQQTDRQTDASDRPVAFCSVKPRILNKARFAKNIANNLLE